MYVKNKVDPKKDPQGIPNGTEEVTTNQFQPVLHNFKRN